MRIYPLRVGFITFVIGIFILLGNATIGNAQGPLRNLTGQLQKAAQDALQKTGSGAQGQQLPNAEFYCFCSAIYDFRIYYSDIFLYNSRETPLGTVQHVFSKYIQEKYLNTSSAMCEISRSASETKARKETAETEFKSRPSNRDKAEIIETGWTLNAASAAQPTGGGQAHTTRAAAPQGREQSGTLPGAANVTGTWGMRLGNRAAGAKLTIRQDDANVTGTLVMEGTEQLPLEGIIEGDRIHFTVKLHNGTIQDFKGTIRGDLMNGLMTPHGPNPGWEAHRRNS